MNVMGSGIVVLDLDGLTSHHAQYVWVITATLLVNRSGSFGNVEGAVAEAVLHIYEYIRQLAAVGNYGFGRVVPLTSGVLAHVDLRGFRRRTVELHGSTYGSRCCGVDGSRGCWRVRF